MTEPAFASAAERNSAPILEILRHEFKQCRSVLEIGSGTGQHAVTFAAELPDLTWQTSDLVETHGWIRANIAASGVKNILSPITLDVRAAAELVQMFDAVYSCNTAHIMSYTAVQKMILLIGQVLNPGGVFCYYGPFRRHGGFNTPSNAAFHETLQSRDAEMGIRDLEDVDTFLRECAVDRQRIYAMPANNYLVVWRKRRERSPT